MEIILLKVGFWALTVPFVLLSILIVVMFGAGLWQLSDELLNGLAIADTGPYILGTIFIFTCLGLMGIGWSRWLAAFYKMYGG